MNTLQIILTMVGWLVPATLTFILGNLVNKIKKQKEVQEKKDEKEQLLIEAVKVMLKREIKEYYIEYKKYCPVAVKAEVQEIYRIYAGLGGNGYGKLMYDEIMALPDNNTEAEI